MRIATFDHGRLETSGDNEIKHASDIADPGKYRFSVPEGLVESNLGATSFNSERSSGVMDERASVGARLLEDGSAAVFIAITDVKGQPIREVLLVSRFGLSGPAASQDRSARITHEGGRFQTIFQGDGNVVTYRRHEDGSLGAPVWASGFVEP